MQCHKFNRPRIIHLHVTSYSMYSIEYALNIRPFHRFPSLWLLCGPGVEPQRRTTGCQDFFSHMLGKHLCCLTCCPPVESPYNQYPHHSLCVWSCHAACAWIGCSLLWREYSIWGTAQPNLKTTLKIRPPQDAKRHSPLLCSFRI